MVTTKRLALAALLSVLVQPGMAQPAQPWPERIVRLITPAPAGGSPDVVGRLFAEKLAERWKAAVVIENRPGADGVIAMEAVLQAKDGHTLLIAQSGILTVTPALRKLPFDVRDLRPLSTAAVDFLALVVPASSSIHSVSNLVAVARERPGIVNWFAPTGAPVVVFQEFVRKNQIDAVYVPYKGGPEALRDLMEGRIHVSLVPLATALPLAESGKLRVIAITNPERAPSLPQVPTAAEAGFPELVLEGVLGFLAPISISDEVRSRIATDIQAIADDPSIRSHIAKGGQVARGSTVAAYEAFLDQQRSHWSQLVGSRDLKPAN